MIESQVAFGIDTEPDLVASTATLVHIPGGSILSAPEDNASSHNLGDGPTQTVERHSQVPAGLDGEGLPRNGRPRSRSQGRAGSKEAESTRNVGTAEAGVQGPGASTSSDSPPWRSTPPEVSGVKTDPKGEDLLTGAPQPQRRSASGLKTDPSAP